MKERILENQWLNGSRNEGVTEQEIDERIERYLKNKDLFGR